MIQNSLLCSIGRFVLVGGSAALLSLILLWLFAGVFGFWYLGASVASYCLAIGYNFFLQRLWTFRSDRDAASRQLLLFILVNLFGLLMNTVIVYALVELFRFWYVAAQAVASLLVAVQSFFAYRWVFHTPAVTRAW